MTLDTKFLKGADKMAQRIRTIRANTGLPSMVEELGQFILRRTLESFDKEEDPDGRKWAPLSDITIRRRIREHFPGETPILNRMGDLRKSIELIRGSAAGTLFSNTGVGVRIGITDPLLAKIGLFLNNGTNRIPARRFLGIGALDIKA